MEEQYVFPEIYFSEETAKNYEKSPRMRKIQAEMTERALELAGFKKQPIKNRRIKVLDVGCGTGHSMKVIKEHGFQSTGVDISEPMLRIAREKGFDVIKADFRSLPFRDRFFDVIISISTLQWITGSDPDSVFGNYKKTATEFKRVLKKNGTAVIQFYPKTEREFELALNAFKRKFKKVTVAIDYPNSPRKTKKYVVLER